MGAFICIDEGRILADIPYDNGKGKEKAKRIPGCRAAWDKTRGDRDVFLGWSYPLSLETCWTFRKVFPDLEVGEDLATWAREEMERLSETETYRSHVDDAQEVLDMVATIAPRTFEALCSRPYQVAGAAFGAMSNGLLLGDEPGLGKTIQTIAMLIQKNRKRILVTCPRTASRAVWERELHKWWPGANVFVAQGTRKEREAAFAAYDEVAGHDSIFVRMYPCIMIVNTEMVRTKKIRKTKTVNHRDGTKSVKEYYDSVPEWPWIHKAEWDAIVMDESHNTLASQYNIGSKHITQGRLGAMKLRMNMARRDNKGFAIALSGTPARSKLERFWGTLNWVNPKAFSSFWRFTEAHFEVDNTHWGRRIGTENELGRLVAVPLDQEIFDKALRPYYLARTKAMAAPDLPPIIYSGDPIGEGGQNAVWLDMEPKQAKAYADMKRMATVRLDSGTLLANGVLAELQRLRQFANAYGRMEGNELLPELPSVKLEWILDFLYERDGHPGKVIIASSYSKMVNWVAAAIRHDKGISGTVLTLTGATSDRDRARLRDRFQDPNDDCRVVVINSKAGGEAITLDQADDIVMIDAPWTGDEVEQVEARAHRVSRIHQVIVHRLAAVGTVDEWIYSLNDEQRATLYAAKPKQAALMFREAINGLRGSKR